MHSFIRYRFIGENKNFVITTQSESTVKSKVSGTFRILDTIYQLREDLAVEYKNIKIRYYNLHFYLYLKQRILDAIKSKKKIDYTVLILKNMNDNEIEDIYKIVKEKAGKKVETLYTLKKDISELKKETIDLFDIIL